LYSRALYGDEQKAESASLIGIAQLDEAERKDGFITSINLYTTQMRNASLGESGCGEQ